MGKNTPNSTWGLSHLLQPAMVHGVGLVWACHVQRRKGDTRPSEWERDPLLQHESQSHWLILRGAHHFPLQDSDYWRLQAPSAVPRISQQRIWCKLALAISADKGRIIQHTQFLWYTKAVTRNTAEKAMLVFEMAAELAKHKMNLKTFKNINPKP